MIKYDGNVYKIDDDAVSVLVLHWDDVIDEMDIKDYLDKADSMDTEALAKIACTMTDELMENDIWQEALQNALEINGYKLRTDK